MTTSTVTAASDMTAAECHQFVEQHGIGRICIVTDGYPLAFPVSYRYATTEEATVVLFRTKPGNTIGRALGPSSFEVEEIDAENRNATTVIARGQLASAATWPDTHPWITGMRDLWLALRVESMTGRRFVGKTSPDEGFAVEWELLPA